MQSMSKGSTKTLFHQVHKVKEDTLLSTGQGLVLKLLLVVLLVEIDPCLHTTQWVTLASQVTHS